MLGQADIVKYFDQCEDALAVEEVFSAYVTWYATNPWMAAR